MDDDDQRQVRRLDWLAYTIDDALRLAVLQPAELLDHATPEVLAENLPRDLMVKVFASAFSTGKLTPEGILSVAPPATLVRHVAPRVLWTSLRHCMHRQQLDVAGGSAPKGKTPARAWLGDVLAAALERGICAPGDVARQVPPREWVREVPLELVARMLGSGLARPTFDPTVALEVLTPEAIGEHVPTHLVWAILDESATRAFELNGS